MAETVGIEKVVLKKLRSLPLEQQQEVLNFVEFLCQKTASKTLESKSLQQIAALPLEERHKLIAPFITATTEDFQTDSELIEFAVLDCEDWELDRD